MIKHIRMMIMAMLDLSKNIKLLLGNILVEKNV